MLLIIVTLTIKVNALLENPTLRMTRQRKVILQELRNASSHLTADEVYDMVRRLLPKISLGTVYRNLELLSESGVIRKLEIGSTRKLFDGRSENHYHVRCVRCGRVDDVPGMPIPAIENTFRDVSDYQITGYQLVLIGVCPACRERELDPREKSESVSRKEKL